MLRDFQIFLFLLLVAQLVWFLIPRYYFVLRVWALVLLSHFFVLYISPESFTFLLLSEFFLITHIILCNYSNQHFVITWTVTLLVISLSILFRLGFANMSTLELIGSGFILLRAIGLYWDLYAKRLMQKKMPELHEMLLLTSFFPTFAAGPIERMERFENLKHKSNLNVDLYLTGLSRIIWGIFKILFLGNVLVFSFINSNFTGIETSINFPPYLVLSFIILKFVGLYLNFSGITDIAMGSGNLFGFELTQNFNKPWLATSIIDFWRRWHISLATFVNAFIFRHVARFVRGKLEYAVFLSFVAMGIWHDLTLQYFLWGVAHGFMMACAFRVQKIRRQDDQFSNFMDQWPVTMLSRIGTLFYVAWLSMLANASSLEAGFKVTLKLIGLGSII